MYNMWKFPNGEIGIRVENINSTGFYKLFLRGCDSDSLVKLLFEADVIKRVGGTIAEIDIDYFPYSRQDRVCNDGESLSLKVIADLINSIGAEEVVIKDPHSDVVGALVNNVRIIPQHEFVNQIDNLDDYTIICPDAGAQKKIEKLNRPYIMCTKVRDTKTGEIKETKVYNDEPLDGKNCLIVDDICDGGRTFIEIAKVLKERKAKSVDLYVTHGFFTKGFDVFKGYINKIYHVKEGSITCESIH